MCFLVECRHLMDTTLDFLCHYHFAIIMNKCFRANYQTLSCSVLFGFGLEDCILSSSFCCFFSSFLLQSVIFSLTKCNLGTLSKKYFFNIFSILLLIAYLSGAHSPNVMGERMPTKAIIMGQKMNIKCRSSAFDGFRKHFLLFII